MDFFSVVARAGDRGRVLSFNYDDELWEAMSKRGAKLSPPRLVASLGTIEDHLSLTIGRALVYCHRSRTAEPDEVEAIQRHEREQLAMAPPVNYVAENAAKDRAVGA